MRTGKTAPLDPNGGTSRHVQVRVPKRETAIIDGVAAQRGTSRAAVVREAIDAWIRDHEDELERDIA